MSLYSRRNYFAGQVILQPQAPVSAAEREIVCPEFSIAARGETVFPARLHRSFVTFNRGWLTFPAPAALPCKFDIAVVGAAIPPPSPLSTFAQ